MNITETARSLFHLFFPHCCAGCGSDVISNEQLLCLSCINRLPLTNFHLYADNPVQHIFRGRLPLVNATSYLYFTKDSLLQHLMHQLKYNNRKDIGAWFGKRIGEVLTASNRFTMPDALLPVPLFATRERKRGYNQAEVLCTGMAAIMGIPVLKDVIVRSVFTESQTRRNRIERWQNMEGKFSVKDAAAIEGRHLLLVDDMITTGATLEACGQALLAAANVRLSVATMGIASR
ncbi:ComF family protein [Paraflavitalea soli]|uniref:ComF family protein n=1 Tax=Paraflavitalea soli TaxID=2315862 RepID=A0A3B7N1S2_9BACT|nr:phosphoribosyltransferase family protein [Paraflavitalea soli]AXY76311.1 ComF family protein [Paraflavitalea soli]